MFAIAFDLVVEDTAENHPKGVSQAYADIRGILDRVWFRVEAGKPLHHRKDDLANLFAAIMALKALPWFPASVRDIRAFKIEHWSDFTG